MREYRLLREHRIDKVVQPIGYVLTLPEQSGDWLTEQGVMTPVDAPAAGSIPRAAPPAAPKFAPPAPRWSCCGKRPK